MSCFRNVYGRTRIDMVRNESFEKTEKVKEILNSGVHLDRMDK